MARVRVVWPVEVTVSDRTLIEDLETFLRWAGFVPTRFDEATLLVEDRSPTRRIHAEDVRSFHALKLWLDVWGARHPDVSLERAPAHERRSIRQTVGALRGWTTAKT